MVQRHSCSLVKPRRLAKDQSDDDSGQLLERGSGSKPQLVGVESVGKRISPRLEVGVCAFFILPGGPIPFSYKARADSKLWIFHRRPPCVGICEKVGIGHIELAIEAPETLGLASRSRSLDSLVAPNSS